MEKEAKKREKTRNNATRSHSPLCRLLLFWKLSSQYEKVAADFESSEHSKLKHLKTKEIPLESSELIIETEHFAVVTFVDVVFFALIFIHSLSSLAPTHTHTIGRLQMCKWCVIMVSIRLISLAMAD